MSKYSISKTPFEVQQELAEKVRRIRKGAKFSQVELARRSGVSLGSLKRFETTGQISLESLLKLLHLLERLHEMENILLLGENTGEVEQLFTHNLRK